MRVLVVTNPSAARGGAETVVATTERLLRRAGHEPVRLRTEPSRRPAVYAPRSRRAAEAAARRLRPDVAHVHNVYEELTLSIVDGLASAGVPVVMTLHDYRAVCPNGYLLAADGPCLRCPSSRSVVPAVVHRCVGGSLRRSMIAAAECRSNRRARRYDVPGALLAPSDFLRRTMVVGGLRPDRIRVVRNPVALCAAKRTFPRHPRFVYAGRLVEQKGVNVLLDAAAMLRGRATVVVYGTGRSEAALAIRVRKERLPVELRGWAPPPAVAAELAASTAAVVPSLWFENGTMAVLEAAASGVPAVASGIGALNELVQDGVTGLLVPPGDPAALAAAMDRLSRSPDLARELGERARERARSQHDPDAYIREVIRAYAVAIAA